MKWDLDEPYLKGKGPMMKLPKSNNVMRRHLRRSRVPEVSPNSRMNCVGKWGRCRHCQCRAVHILLMWATFFLEGTWTSNDSDVQYSGLLIDLDPQACARAVVFVFLFKFLMGLANEILLLWISSLTTSVFFFHIAAGESVHDTSGCHLTLGVLKKKKESWTKVRDWYYCELQHRTSCALLGN